MDGYFVDIGWQSHNKHGELLCGDSVEIARQGEGSAVMVLADGLGSGVKANILSTLTAKIIATMIASEMGIEDCVKAVAATLPVCEVRKIAYSTFTIVRVDKTLEAEIIQFDNPRVFLLRDGKNEAFPEISEQIGGKAIRKSRLRLRENDALFAVSDGVVHAGVGRALNFGWRLGDVVKFMERAYRGEHAAKALAAILCEQCLALYGGKPGDDTTACAVKVRRRNSVSLLIGPPADPAGASAMMSLFFSKGGKHIVCGGTTSQLAAEHLKKPLRLERVAYPDPAIPPTAGIEGVDLVTEGVVTINRVLEYAKNCLGDNSLYLAWSSGGDGASQIARMLIEEATDINFYVGRAVNPAHQNPDLPIGFSIKMRLVEELAEALRSMSKQIRVSYF